jgi:hypothetical protein
MSLAFGRPCTSGIPSPPDTTTARPAVQCCAMPFLPTGCTVPCTARRRMASATRTVLSCVLLRADAAVAALTTPLSLPRVPSALRGTLVTLPYFSAPKGMRSGRAISTLPRGAVAGVAAAPAPLVSARPPAASRLRRCCSSPPSCCFVSRARLRGGLEIRAGGIWTRRKSFDAPVLTFGTDVNLPLTSTYVPKSGRRPQVGHRAI